MKTISQQLLTSFQSKKSLEWGKLIAIAGSAQAVIQAIGIASSILIIRLLPTQEYALYTLATTMLANMVILADSGIKTSVLAQGGRVWQDRQKLGEVIATGFFLRKLFATASIIIASPIMLFLLRHHGASWLVAVGIVFALLPAFHATLSGALLDVVPYLQQSIVSLQRIQLKASIFRVVLLGISLIFFPVTIVALMGYGISQLWANTRLRKLAHSFIDASQKPSPVIRAEILQMVKRLLPESVYLCLSGHITLWLISVFGTTAAVAQVGALGRLAMALSLFSVLFGTLISPRFSRLNNKEVLLRRFGQVQIGLTLLGLGIVGGTWAFATEMLWLLGPEYSNLEQEIVLLMTGNWIGLFAVSTFSLCTNRGWVINPLISIPVSMIGIISGALLFNISTLQGVFVFNIFNNSVILVLHVAYGFYRIHSIKEELELQV